ncbi:hypothetical protein [Methyloglobulus morosus]|uniref:hypothetical protein n=1 Tax=Methyloglobulus morosus TaxID=1410681 RepID=UPI000423C346|nr:hypothetical protein [Methyloglobulus morosus]
MLHSKLGYLSPNAFEAKKLAWQGVREILARSASKYFECRASLFMTAFDIVFLNST